MLDKKMKEFNEISLNSEPVKEANRPAALQAWDSFKAKSYANAMTRITNPRNAVDAWNAYKYNKAVAGQQTRQSMTDMDYFNTESVSNLGFGPSDVTYEKLMQLAYDGKIKITDPGERRRLVVNWTPGWDASNYQESGAGRLGAGSMDQNTAEKTRGLIDAIVEQKRTGTAAVYDYLKPMIDAANEANANRQEKAPTWLEVLEGGITSGGASVVDAIGATLYALEDNLILKPLEWLTGVETQGLFEKPYKDWHQQYTDYNQQYQQMLSGGDDWQQGVGKYLPMVTAAVPQVLLALATSGASTATTATLQATSAAAQATGTAATVLAIANTAKQFAMNPSFQYAFASTFGNEYMQAKEDGASDAAAYLYAMLASTVNAAVEVGGGIEGDIEPQKPLLRQWAKTAVEEGGEEVVQGVISQAFQNAIYNKGNALASLTDENAILSGKRAAEEFAGGAIVGGVLGGGQIAAQASLNKANGVKNNWLRTPPNAVVSDLAAGDTQTQVQDEKPATDAGAKAAGVNTQNSAVAFMAAGDDVLTATVKGAVMDRVLAGDQTLTNKDLRRLQMNSATTRQVFEELTGMALPMTTDTKTLLNAVRATVEKAAQPSAPNAVENAVGTDYTVIENKEDVSDGSTVHLRGSGERYDGTDPQGSVSAVEGNAGQDQSRAVQRGSADGEISALSYGEEVSTAQLGIEGGSTDKNIRVVTSGETADIGKARQIAQERGLQLTLFAGNNLTLHGKNGAPIRARAYIEGDRVFVRADHPEFTAEQLMRHEAGHDMIDKGEINPDSVRDRIVELHGSEKLDELSQMYADAYAGSNMTADEIWEEIICDSLGDMNIFAGKANEATATEMLSDVEMASTEMDADSSRGPPETFKLSRETKRGGTDDGGEVDYRGVRGWDQMEDPRERVTESAGNSGIYETGGTQTGIGVYARAGGQDVHTLDSEGRRVSEELSRQLKNTSVVDENGRPLAVYHFTPEMEFQTFEEGDIGFHFGTQAQAEKRGTDLGVERGRMFRAYLNIRNPVNARLDLGSWQPLHTGLYLYSEDILTEAEWNEVRTLGGRGYNSPASVRLREILESKGYDGIVYPNGIEGVGKSYIALHDEQIVRTDVQAAEVKTSRETDVPNLSEDAQTDIAATQEAVRAAVREELERMGKEYGWIKPGEKPYRDVQIPQRTAEDNKVYQTVRTILEAETTPEDILPDIEALVAQGEFSYDVYTDKAAIADAESAIRDNGFAGSLAEWLKSVDKGIVSKANTAQGWALYNAAVNSGDTKTAIDIINRMVEHQHNAAQAVQATRILKKLSPDAQLYAVQRSVRNLQEEINKRYKTDVELKIDEDLAADFLKADTEEDRTQVLKQIYRNIGKQVPSRFIDKWNAWRYLAMLGNVRTHVRNVVGNAGFVPVVLMKNTIATGLETAASKLTGGKIQRTKSAIGFGGQDMALLKAAFGDYGNAADHVGTGKYSDFTSMKSEIEEGRQIFKTLLLEKARKANSKALSMEDEWFAKTHYAYALAQYCKANGITAEQIANGDVPDAARVYAIKEAKKATYQDANQLSEFFSRIGRYRGDNDVMKGASIAVEGILPFRKTPANILARGVEYSPIGLIKTISYDIGKVKKGEMSSAEMFDDLASNLTGSMLLGLGWFAALSGLVRGSGEDDDDEREFNELMGHQSYALELPDGTSITLDWLAPECLPFFVGVNLCEVLLQRQEEGEALTMADILGAVGKVSDPMLEMSCLQSLSDVFDSVGYASSNDMNPLVSALASAVTSYLTQGIPTLLGQFERSGEDVRMTTYTEKNAFLTSDMQYFFGKASSKILGWDYNQIPYIDAWGRTETTGGVPERIFNNMFNPAYTSEIETSPMEEELLRLYEATGEVGVFPSRADKYFTVNKERKDLTAEEYVKYATTRGQTAMEIITDLTENREYAKLDDTDKAAVVKLCYELANAKAKMEVSNYQPDGWIAKALKCCEDNNIPPELYIICYQAQKGVEGLKDKDGNTISNSSGLLKMQIINGIGGLTYAQRQEMFAQFGVGGSVILYTPDKVDSELNKMRK